LELAGVAKNGASVFVDYAHTPDALENAILALKPYVSGKLSVVFGCGGDRDKGKRPLMGEVANRLAARVYVTDDNPRTEEPTVIRAEILSTARGAIEIPDRATAIAQAITDLGQGDILLVAGKGHEEGQIIGQVTIPFSDHDAVTAALRGEKYHGE
jgi:UDP-N-acetylmuramoyl-L-alanyl-D-glutamate--2,6-diaminopimelate ligase